MKYYNTLCALIFIQYATALKKYKCQLKLVVSLKCGVSGFLFYNLYSI